MGLLDSIWNGLKLVRLVDPFLLELIFILAAIAAHDNRLDFNAEERPETAVQELALTGVVPEMTMSAPIKEHSQSGTIR